MSRDERIRDALYARPANLTPGALALGRAIWGVQPPLNSHVRCQEQLPTLVEADLDHRSDPRTRFAKRHLLICDSCAKIYIELLELAELELDDGLPHPDRTPPPDLGFLDQSDE